MVLTYFHNTPLYDREYQIYCQLMQHNTVHIGRAVEVKRFVGEGYKLHV